MSNPNKVSSIERVVASVVDVQQTIALQLDSISKGLEALKLENQSGVAQLLEEIRRSDDRSQKQISEMKDFQSKELERLHQIINTLLARNSSSTGATTAIVPSTQQLQQQQQQRMIVQCQLEQIAYSQAHARAQAQNQAMVNLLSAANNVPKQNVVPVQQSPHLHPQVPTQIAPVPFVSQATYWQSSQSFPPPTTSVVEKPATSTPVTSGFSFGGTASKASIASPAVVPPAEEEDDEDDDEEEDEDDEEDEEDDDEEDEDYEPDEPDAVLTPDTPLPELDEVKTGETKKEMKEEGFGDKFKPTPGSWECSGCYISCKAEETECACCGTTKDGTTKEKNIFSKPSILQPAPGTPKVTFGFGASAPVKTSTVQTSSQLGALLSTNSSIFGVGTANTPTFSSNKPAETKIEKKEIKEDGSKPGSWECPLCSDSCKAEETECASCGTYKDEDTKQKIMLSVSSIPLRATGVAFFAKPAGAATTSATTPSFNFNKPAGSTASPAASITTGLSKTAATTTPSFSFNKSSESIIPKPGFSFGKQVTATASPAPEIDPSKSVFGSFAAGGPTFASLAATGTGSIFDTSNAQKAQQELAAQKRTSVFGSTSNTPNTTANTSSTPNDTTEDGEYEAQVDFQPVIPLPDLVEVKTGEEDEEVVFTARCKLYKFYSTTQENKERGVGDIKLLKSKDNKYRIVMRREQVHKLCANFRIEKTMKLNPKPNLANVLSFMCQDFSEDPSDANASIFTAKFKDEATANSFKKAIHEAQATM